MDAPSPARSAPAQTPQRLRGMHDRLPLVTGPHSESARWHALEAHIRQLAFELAPLGVTANSIRAGVTDTPALRRIPEGVALLERAAQFNPSGRPTTPEDVAQAIAALTDERLHWLTGNVLGVDGGEEITV